jgi:branched-chain amino acid transport system permease protein
VSAVTVSSRTGLRPASPWALAGELGLVAAGLLLLALVIKVHWLTDFMIFFILVLSFDLLYGFMGHLSFGHMLYFGAGAYGAALWLVYGSKGPLTALAAGIVLAALLAAVLGGIVMRTHGASFALINMAFNEIGHFAIQSPLSSVTHGEDGLSCTADRIFGVVNLNRDAWAFGFAAVMLLAVFALLRALTRSPYGILVRSIRENEQRVKFLGYDTFRYKWATFVIASTVAGLAGGMFTLVQGFVSPRVISPFGNVDVIFAVLIGGAGTLYGALIGGTVFMLIKNFLPVLIPELSKLLNMKLPQWEMWLGVVLLVIVFSARRGIVGTLQAKWSARRTAGGVA